MIKVDMNKKIDIDQQEADEGVGSIIKNGVIFAGTYAAGKGIGAAGKKIVEDGRTRRNLKEDERERLLKEYYKTPEGREKLRQEKEEARKEAKELNKYLKYNIKAKESFEGSSIALAEEGIFSKAIEAEKEKREKMKNAKYIEEFNDQKESLIKTSSKKIGELEGEDERLNNLMREEDTKCFNALIKMHSSLISLLNTQIEKLEAVEFENRDSIEELNEIFSKFNKDKKYESTMKLIKKEYPKSYSRATQIINMSEDTYKKELKKHRTLTKLTKDDNEDDSAIESFINESLTDLIAEEGILSLVQTKISILKDANDKKDFDKIKKGILDEKSKSIKDIDRFTKRVSKATTDYNKSCFNKLVGLMWTMRGLFASEIKEIDEVEIVNDNAKEAIDKLRNIEREYRKKSLKTQSKISKLEGKYPDTCALANKIADFENYWSNESSFNKDLESMKENEKGLGMESFSLDKIVAEESILNIKIGKNVTGQDIYYGILSKNYDKNKRLLNQFFSGKKRYEIPKYILSHIVDIKNNYFPTIGRAINDALDTYDRTKPLLNKEKSFIYKTPELDRDEKIVQRFQSSVDLLNNRKESYKLDTMDDFISSKTGSYEEHRYDNDTIIVDANYLKNILQIDETMAILKKLDTILKELPNLEEYTVLAKYSKEIAKYTNLEIFDSSVIKAPIHAYYNYITEFTLFMQYVNSKLNSYVAAIYEVLNYITVK